jgi:hypothetical protein
LMRHRGSWRSLKGRSLGVACLWVPDCAESGPQSLYLVRHSEGSGNSNVRDPTTSMELWCHMTFSVQTLLNGVWPRELLCFGFSALESLDPMVVETWIEMLKETLKHISSLLGLDAFVDTFLGAWMSGASLIGVSNSLRLPIHVPSSKTRSRHNDPPLTVKGPPLEQTCPTDTCA